MDITQRPFGRLPDGTPVQRFDLDGGEVSVGILDYGGILASIRVPDARGDVADVALGFDDLDGWLDDPQFFGALAGRYANRIAFGRFTLDGLAYDVGVNRSGHHLHGGTRGFDKVVWHAEPVSDDEGVGLRLTLHSPDGDQGYPGAMDVVVTYRLDRAGALGIHYEAVSEAPTVVNLTNHVYLDLGATGSIVDHVVELSASRFLEIGEGTIPTGRILGVEGTPMDFTVPHRIGDRVDADDPQLRLAGGYDHCWVVDGEQGRLRPCAVVTSAGRRLEVSTTQPGVQFYSGNGIRARIGRGGVPYGARSGFCLETQHFPDSPNHPTFPSTRLDPGERLSETTVYRFGAA
jgi:aldose 1-epimerase